MKIYKVYLYLIVNSSINFAFLVEMKQKKTFFSYKND